jgi:hypothetical protein
LARSEPTNEAIKGLSLADKRAWVWTMGDEKAKTYHAETAEFLDALECI